MDKNQNIIPLPNEPRHEFMERCIEGNREQGISNAYNYCTIAYNKELENQLYWKKIDSQRRKYIKKYAQLFYSDVYKANISAVIRDIEHSRRLKLTTVLDTNNISNAYLKLYNDVGIDFAMHSYRDIYSRKSTEDEAIAAEMRAQINLYIQANLTSYFTSILTTQKDKINEIIDRALSEGLSIPDAVKLIKEEFDIFSKYAATRIARTEVLRASSYGGYIGAGKAAKKAGLRVRKRWISTRDGRTRKGKFDHVNADGQTVDYEAPYVVSNEDLNYPHDPIASAGNTINCRCTQRFVTTRLKK